MKFKKGDRVHFYATGHDGDLGTITDNGSERDGEITYGVVMDTPCTPAPGPDNHWGYEDQFEIAFEW